MDVLAQPTDMQREQLDAIELGERVALVLEFEALAGPAHWLQPSELPRYQEANPRDGFAQASRTAYGDVDRGH